MVGGRRPPRRSRGLGQGNDSYQGYGVPTPRAPCPPGPEQALVECVRAMQQILKDTLQMAQLAPWIHPPFRARSFCGFERVIVSTTAALNAGVNAAGLALQAALTVPGVPPFVPRLEEMAVAGEFRTIFTLSNPQNVVTRVASWGVEVTNVNQQGVLLRVRAGSVAGGPPSPPSPLLSTADVEGHQPVFLVLQGNQVLQIQAALRDVTLSPAVVDFGVCAWSWPVRVRDDSPEGVIPRTGYGTDC